MIEEPVYSAYSFKKASISSTEKASVRYDVIDRRAERHSTGLYASRQTEQHTVLYGLNDQDRNKARHTREAIDETSVNEFESYPFELKVSKILASFTVGAAEAEPLKGLAALRKDLTAKRKKAVVAAKTEIERIGFAVHHDEVRDFMARSTAAD